MINNIQFRKINLSFLIITFLCILFSFIGIFVSKSFDIEESPKIWKKVPIKIEISPYYFVKNYTFPFYFTIQSNLFGLIYFYLIYTKKINPNKSKKSFIFETIVFMNLLITIIVFWGLLAPFINFSFNKYDLISSIFLHALVPLLVFFSIIYRVFFLEKQEVFLKYKDFIKILIYPIIYFIISIILYYSTRGDFTYQYKYNFENKNLANDFASSLKRQNINYEISKNFKEIILNISGIWGNAVYIFFNFDNIIWWFPVVSIISIFCLFLVSSLIYIKCIKKFAIKIPIKIEE